VCCSIFLPGYFATALFIIKLYAAALASDSVLADQESLKEAVDMSGKLIHELFIGLY